MKIVNSYIAKIDEWLLHFLHFGVVLLIVGIPAYPKFPIITIPETYVSIRAEDFLIALVGVIWIFYVRNKWKDLWKMNVIKAATLFLLVGALASLSAIFLTQTGRPLQILLHTLRRWEYLAVLPIIITVIRTPKEALYYFKIVLLTIGIVLIYGLGQKFFDWPIISTMNKEYSQGIAQAIAPGGRINSTFAGHYDLAAYGVVMMSLLFGFMAASKYWSSRFYLLVLILGNGWLLVVSASRISFASYLGSILLTMIMLRKWIWIIPVMGISLLAFLRTPALMDRYAETIKYEFLPRIARVEWPWEKWGDTRNQIAGGAPIPTLTPTPTLAVGMSGSSGGNVKISPTATPTPRIKPPKSIAGTELHYVAPPEDRSTAIRFKVEWPRAMRAWSKNPLLGTGYSSITLATDNDYIRALGETGILGFLAFVTLLVSILVEIWNFIRIKWRTPSGSIVIGYLGGMCGFLVNGLFIDVFEASKIAIYFWILTGIIIAFMFRTSESDKNIKI